MIALLCLVGTAIRIGAINEAPSDATCRVQHLDIVRKLAQDAVKSLKTDRPYPAVARSRRATRCMYLHQNQLS